jgi:hypothetical protein
VLAEIEEENEARKLFDQCKVLKKIRKEDNIFCDFSCQKKGGIFSKKRYKFKLYYKANRKSIIVRIIFKK